MRGWLMVGFGLAMVAHLQGQVIWSESFAYPNGTTVGANNNAANPAVDWVATCPSCVSGDWYEVQNNVLEGRDTNGEAEMTTESIDISGAAGGVEVLFDLSEDGPLEDCPGGISSGCNAIDWIKVEYKLDNAAWISVGSPVGGPCSGACAGGIYFTIGDFTAVSGDICPLVGDSLRLRFTVQTWASDEYLRVDNIVVQGQTCAAPIIADSVVDLRCNGDNTGEIWIMVSGSVLPYTYSLNGGPFQSANNFTGLAAGTYAVVVQDGNGAQYPVTVQVNEPPTLALSVTTTPSVCIGATGTATATATGGVSPYTYAWNTTPPQSGAIATGLSAGQYTLTLTDDQGCQTNQTVTITAPAQPNAFAGADDTLCDGQITTLQGAASGGGASYSFAWSPGAGLSDSTVANPQIQVSGSQCFVLRVTSDGCTSEPDTVCLTVVPAYVAQLPSDTVLCEGDSVLLRAIVNLSGAQFAWSAGGVPIAGVSADSLWVQPGQSTTYIVMPANLAGCPGVGDSITVQVELPAQHPQPLDIEFCPGEPLVLGVDPMPNFIYRWNPMVGLGDPFASITPVLSLESQIYQLSATDTTLQTARCRTAVLPVNLLLGDCLFPNVITPNGDGINDVLNLGPHFNRVTLVVMDRWGAQVFAQDGYQNDWDGRNMQGEALAEGVYYYRLIGHWTGFAQAAGSPMVYDAVHVLTLLR